MSGWKRERHGRWLIQVDRDVISWGENGSGLVNYYCLVKRALIDKIREANEIRNVRSKQAYEKHK